MKNKMPAAPSHHLGLIIEVPCPLSRARKNHYGYDVYTKHGMGEGMYVQLCLFSEWTVVKNNTHINNDNRAAVKKKKGEAGQGNKWE